jgi:DNA alkylation repair enzyme
VKTYFEEIQQFYRDNADPANVKKYQRYFTEGYDAYGVDGKLTEKQRATWLKEWNDKLSWNDWLDLADLLLAADKYEENMCGVSFIIEQRERLDAKVFDRVEAWYANGWIRNWAQVDVSATQILQPLVLDGHVEHKRFAPWRSADSKWQRRASAVASIGMLGGQMSNAAGVPKGKAVPEHAIPVEELCEFVRPMVGSTEKVIQQGAGWFLKRAWVLFPDETEAWLIAHRDELKPFVMRYATEKMDAETKARVKGPKKSKAKK